ncbi:MAG TPA: flagellar basal body P-ring formation chaperone FlgA [Terriglobia bacterium]|nr:flagellar basal body P-ring formation chaperone FlgA [Terriglobia bacterium]
MITLILACCLAVPADVAIDTDTVTLGSIVAFQSGDARAAISLGSSPQPGLVRRFLKQELIAKLSTARLPSDDLQFPESVVVRRKSQKLDPVSVFKVVSSTFAKQFPDADIDIISTEVPDVDLATGKLEITGALPDRPDPSIPVFVSLEIRAPGFTRKVFIKTVVDIRRPQPTLRNAISANSEVRVQDLEWKVMPVRGRGEQILDAGGLDGFLAKRDLQAGDVLTADLLYAPLLVHKGESVTVKASNGAVTIAATMRARASAHLGETISVEHLSGAGFTSARVIGPRLLEATQGAK